MTKALTPMQKAERAMRGVDKKKKGPTLEITKVLTLSTMHITEQDDRLLQMNRDPDLGTWFKLAYQGDVDTVGYMVYVTMEDIFGEEREALANAGWSKAIHEIQSFAKLHGCDHIRLDPDGPTADGLESYNW